MTETLEFVEHYNKFADDIEWYVFLPERKEKFSDNDNSSDNFVITRSRLLIGVIMKSWASGEISFYPEFNRMVNVYYGADEFEQITKKIRELEKVKK